MSSRSNRSLQLSEFWRKRIQSVLADIQEELAAFDGADAKSGNRCLEEEKALKTQEDKLLALLYADEAKSMQQIEKLLGRSKSNVQEWIERFRDGCQDKMETDVLSQLLEVRRHRDSRMMKMEVLVGLLRATLQGKVTTPDTAAAWLNATFGEKYGLRMTPEAAEPWLGNMPVHGDPKASALSDEQLEQWILESSGLFPAWEAARVKRRRSGRSRKS